MTLTLDFQGQILKKSYLRNGMADWHEIKGRCETIECCTHVVTFNVHITHDLDLWFSRSNFEKVVSQEWDADWHGIKGRCETIECCTHVVTFNVHITHDLDLWFSRSNFEKVVSQEWDADWHGIKGMWVDWHGIKGMWVDRMLDPCCDFQLSPHPWPWPWIFKVKFWKSLILWMGWPFDMERKGCESIECWAHVVTFNVHLFHDLDLGFSRSNLEIVISQEWDGRLTWNKRDVGR